MPKLGPIFAGGQEEEEMKPLYEHLDGTVEVLGFEQYGLNQVLPTLSKENHQFLHDPVPDLFDFICETFGGDRTVV